MKKIITITFLNFAVTFLSLLIPATARCMSDLEFVQAAQRGDLQAVKEALPRANIDARVGDGELTALRQASQDGHLAVAKLLLEAHAQPHILDKYKGSPLAIASHRGHYDIVDLLLKNGALITINVMNDAGRTPLHLASIRGHIDIVRALVFANADVETLDSQTCSPLFYASYNDKGDVDVVNFLLEHGGLKTISKKTVLGNLPIHAASKGGSLPIVKRLIKEAPETVNALSNQGHTPLHVAIDYGKYDIALLLLMHKADPALLDAAGNTAFHYAKNPEMRALLEVYIQEAADAQESEEQNKEELRGPEENGEEPEAEKLVVDEEHKE